MRSDLIVANGNTVNSTQFDRRQQNIVLAVKGDDRRLSMRIKHEHILYQLVLQPA